MLDAFRAPAPTMQVHQLVQCGRHIIGRIAARSDNKNPRTFIPGNKMAFPGVKQEAQIRDIIAYLRQATK